MSTGLTRRSSAESLALAAIAPAIGVKPALLVASNAPSPMAEGAEFADPGALARALAGAIRAQYGARLGRTDLATVTRQIQGSLDRAAQIRTVALANGDEPDFVFSATRGITETS